MRTKTELEYIKTAKKIEAELGVKACIIKRNPTCPIPMTTNGGEYNVYIISPTDNTHSILIKARTKFPFIEIHQTPPVEELVNLFHSRPELIRTHMASDRLIPPFFFHEEVYGNYAKNFRRTLRRELGSQLNKAIRERLERLGIKSEKDYAKKVEMLRRLKEIKKKVIGPKEHKYLVKELDRMAKEIKESDAEVLIFFDRAARYLAEPLKKILLQLHQRKPEVFFVDPNLVRNAEFEFTYKTGTKTNYEELKALFEREFPQLIKTIKGKRVMLVDDQSCMKNSKNGMIRLLNHYQPKALHYTELSSATTAPQPSWREQELYLTESKARSFRVQKLKFNAQKRRQVKGLKQNLNRVANRVIRGRR